MSVAQYASNFPSRAASDFVVRGIPLLQAHPGKVVWLSNNNTNLDPGPKAGSDSGGGTFNRPYATLKFAVSQCRAGKGDIIMIKPGHVETLSAAAAVAMSKADVAVVGLGV